jgi:hypothetical protein
MTGTPTPYFLSLWDDSGPDHHRFAVAYASCTIALGFPVNSLPQLSKHVLITDALIVHVEFTGKRAYPRSE